MQIDQPVVEILLATFNGGSFLAQQIESILAQDYQQIRIIIRDDGSTDGTIGIVKEFIRQHPEKICLFDDVPEHLGANMGFMALLQSSRADYVMFADQDDVWLKDKISMSMAAMEQSEASCGKNTPLLLHTDLMVADSMLAVVSKSFWKYQGLSPECASINRLLVQNVVTGCTVMMNRSLVKLVRPAGSGMIGHDWWLGLLASAFGKIIYLPQATMFYRQHGKNTVGAVKWNVSGMLGKFFDADAHRVLADRLRQTRQQAALFLSVHGDVLPQDVQRMILRYATLHELNYLSRGICVLRYRFFKIGILRNIAMMLLLRKN